MIYLCQDGLEHVVSKSLRNPCDMTILLRFCCQYHIYQQFFVVIIEDKTQPAKVDLNKKSFPKQKTIQNFTIYAQGFRKTKNENPPTWEIEVTS